jgi:hypothetical protein
MSILPLAPWVAKARKAVLWVGFGWPVAVIFLTGFFAKRGGVDWAINGILILTVMFAPISLVLGLILPTYKSRMVVIPPVLLFVYWLVLGGSRIMLYTVLSIVTLTAIALVVPQHSTLEFFFRRLFARRVRR